MAERIHNLEKTGTYRVYESDDPQKRKNQNQNNDGDDESNQENEHNKPNDSFENFDEKTNWQNFIEQSRFWKKTIKIEKNEIDKIYFGKINVKTDPSLLRINIKLKNGVLIKPGFISLAREHAIKCQHLKPGTVLSFETICKDKILRVTLPQDPNAFNQKQQIVNKKDQSKVKLGLIKRFLSWMSLVDVKTGGFRAEGFLVILLILAILVLVGSIIYIFIE